MTYWMDVCLGKQKILHDLDNFLAYPQLNYVVQILEYYPSEIKDTKEIQAKMEKKPLGFLNL